MTDAADTPEITYRLASLRDVDAIHEFFLALTNSGQNPYLQFIDNPVRIEWEMKRLRRQLVANDEYICVVAQGPSGDLVGYAAGSIERNPNIFATTFYASVDEVWVAPDDRRQGIATALIEHLVEGFTAVGAKRLSITAAAQHVAGAGPLLAKLGFAPVSTTYDRDLTVPFTPEGESADASPSGEASEASGDEAPSSDDV